MTDTLRGIGFMAEMLGAIDAGRKGRKKLYAKRGQDRNSPEFIAARILNSISINLITGCWNWARHINNMGYGRINIDGQLQYAHRVSYQLAKGSILPDENVLHACDNPACVNPDHLRAGSRSDNMRDCYQKGRSRIPSPRFPGESNPASKLTEINVREIKSRLTHGDRQQKIAEDFGVSQSAVSNIARGRAWAWL